MLVFFLRHANAGQRRSNPKVDEKRPLDREGIEQSRYIGRLLSVMEVHVDLIVSSPLKRATQTAALVGNEIGYEGRLVLDNAMKPGATFEQFRALLRTCNRLEAIMVVGHNPNMARFLSLLVTNGANDRGIEMKKGSIARVDFTEKRTIFNWMITPKIAKAYYLSMPQATPIKKLESAKEPLPVARPVGKVARKKVVKEARSSKAAGSS
ncbi:MAG TPA: histidine phosphatase family protein [candidate division Zixibacteria bacterium]|nr:histidine phosphatase family protein [candidate division Zixibacteria bacterium]